MDIKALLKKFYRVKTLKKVTIQVKTGKEWNDSARVIVRITEKEKAKKHPEFRVSLWKESREIHSILTEAGKATFEYIKPASYEIVITKEGDTLARIYLDLKQ